MLDLLLTLILAAPAPPPAATATIGTWTRHAVSGAIDGVRARHDLLVYLPPAAPAHPPRPLVVALHGWNHSAALFRDQGELARWADRYAVVVAVPDMGKTIYETAFHPETRAAKAWSQVPGARWVGEVILPYLRAHLAVRSDRAHTAVIGYSTGGRGAFLLAALYPEFAFAGSASGTFDLMRLGPKTGEYRIHEVIYGARAAFSARWQHDNVLAPEHLAKLAGVRLYATHGGADKSVDPDQLDALRAALPAGTVATLELVPRGAHDWRFWNGSWEAMFAAMHEVFAATP